jgi:sigma-54-interacting transcriptional regulator
MLRSRDGSASRPTTTSLRPDEWHLLVTARPNALLEGPPEATDAILGEAMEWLAEPHATWSGAPLSNDRPATLVVRSVSALDGDQQRALLAWLDAPGDRIQVISTTTDPLYPLVDRGAFLPNLYYRLNVLLLDVAATSTDRAES